MTPESLSTCPNCKSDACYISPLNEVANNYFCFGCGFVTNDLQKENEFDIQLYEESIPELYKDVKVVDEEGRIWYPATINIPDKGTVFLNGTSAITAHWCAIKVRKLTKEEKGEIILAIESYTAPIIESQPDEKEFDEDKYYERNIIKL